MNDRTTFLTPPQVAAQLQVSVDTVMRALRSGRLQGVKAGRQWRIRLTDLEAFLERRATETSGH